MEPATEKSQNFFGGSRQQTARPCRWERVDLHLRFSSRTVLRLPSGASCRAKQSGWMLMPTRETMQGCCRECNILASWRNSEKLREASADCRCFTMVSVAKDSDVREGHTDIVWVALKFRAVERNKLGLHVETSGHSKA